MVGAVGFAPTQHVAPVLQTGSALSLRRAPIDKFRISGISPTSRPVEEERSIEDAK